MPWFAKSLVDKVMREPRPNMHVLRRVDVFELNGVVLDEFGEVFSTVFAREVFNVLVYGIFEHDGIRDVV